MAEMLEFDLEPLYRLITKMAALLAKPACEDSILLHGKPLLAELVRSDHWLPAAFAQPHPEYYQQYLLHCDSRERFSVVSFVWGPGQATPIHDHTVWGIIGMLRGAELSQRYRQTVDGLSV